MRNVSHYLLNMWISTISMWFKSVRTVRHWRRLQNSLGTSPDHQVERWKNSKCVDRHSTCDGFVHRRQSVWLGLKWQTPVGIPWKEFEMLQPYWVQRQPVRNGIMCLQCISRYYQVQKAIPMGWQRKGSTRNGPTVWRSD